VIPALHARGVTAVAEIWDHPSVRWAEYRLVVVRSTWDYADRRDEFLRWSAALPRVRNAVDVLAWNTDKLYLRELAVAGIRVVPTTWIAPGTPPSHIVLPREQVVIKPAISAGARNTVRFDADAGESAAAMVARLLAEGRTVMVQPYVTAVDRDGETALIYFAGAFSHAIRKGPLLREPGRSSRELWAPETITARQPALDERALAEDVLDALRWSRSGLLYARVDLVRGEDGTPMLLELELTEPSLFLAHGDGAAERFADAIVRAL
jgi:glutathione synthase/RimK-type ligase-like ATP-grasp enzyme